MKESESYYNNIFALRRKWGNLITNCLTRMETVRLQKQCKSKDAILKTCKEGLKPFELSEMIDVVLEYSNEKSIREFRKECYRFKKEISSHHIDPRTKVVLFLGGKCKTCNSEEIDELEIDHIKGDGYEDREYFKREQINIWNYYSIFLEEAAQKLQLLCYRCHMEKTLSNGDHLHKRTEEIKPEISN